ncbi:TPA: DUF2309 domain-containing protein [Legionella pneumophila]|nr:DUF2309 domain-containing protein [Legionella pneumophila subsp. fraseri]HAT1797638.1 DUF2309 domain-containing protein [Legionella pneumophila]MDW8963264.1 DUF2309 domain-containing protein [Legionella pneumophila subsp. fraseri]MDW9036956.1 DUF2309 domain-containing protein [Legionella pneumophila subsp. fraseri]MDW9040111.1 DUF2309 domain-containing protein [Legionella pneumophila subsp. fraseri]
MVNNVAKQITPVWPLEKFIACNPLHGFESMSFEEAVLQNQTAKRGVPFNENLEKINWHMIKWCGSFLDIGQGTIEMPHRDKGLYFGFLKLAPFDSTLHQNNKSTKAWLANLPEMPEQAIRLCLDKLGILIKEQEKFLQTTLSHLPGWAGYIKWISEWKNRTGKEENPVSLVDFLAVRLVLTCLLWPEAAQEEKKKRKYNPDAKKIIEKIKNKEDVYRQLLLNKLLPELNQIHLQPKRPDAQMVFCIDVRSEPFRRSIEKLGHYETLGFAGFFGLPVSLNDYDNEKKKDSCPVLLKPRFSIYEKPVAANEHCIEHRKKGKAFKNHISRVYQQLKYNFSTPFTLVESLGIWCGITMLLKSCVPLFARRLYKDFDELVCPPIQTQPVFELDLFDQEVGISLKEQTAYAEMALRLMGLTDNFAKLIIFCGHGSSTQNNPYASSLDCGACGGNQGGKNAQLLASILNKTAVRRALAENGINIPQDTEFYGAQHDTTTDEVEIYYSNVSQSIHQDILEQLRIDLKAAKRNNNLERFNQLKATAPAQKDIARRSVDWSETRPEWGLARNAAFIIAPRQLTKNINLESRCFLHSYDWRQDKEGALLETILTAPMVVAQWINTQYLFSTIDNVAYGSGSKITHNVTGKIGVMQGNASDLMHGLPLQSVMSNDDTPFHEPQRLLTIAYAPREIVSELIEKQDVLKTLFFNEWVHLVVIDPRNYLFYRLEKTNTWTLIQ